MIIKKHWCYLQLLLLCYPFFLKGQSVCLEAPKDFAIEEVYIANENISLLFDSIVTYWNLSPIKDTYSYAIVVPRITYYKQLVWQVWIKQLYDYDVFAMSVTDYLSFARTYVPLGVLRYNQHVFIVGSEKDYSGRSVDKYSQGVVDSNFFTSSNQIRFNQDSIEKKIFSSEYVHQVDTIGGKGWDWEMSIFDRYDELVIEYIETNNGYVCRKKEVVKE